MNKFKYMRDGVFEETYIMYPAWVFPKVNGVHCFVRADFSHENQCIKSEALVEKPANTDCAGCHAVKAGAEK